MKFLFKSFDFQDRNLMDPQVETCMPEGNQSVHAHTYAILKTTDRAYYKRTDYLIQKPSTKR